MTIVFDLNRFSNIVPIENDSTTFNLLYAGIIGHAQGLEVILYAAKKLESNPRLKFYLIGDGPVKNHLLSLQKHLELSNIEFIPNKKDSISAGLYDNVDHGI